MVSAPEAATTESSVDNQLVPWILRTVAVLGLILGGVNVLAFPFASRTLSSFANLGAWEPLLILVSFVLNIGLVIGSVKCMARPASGRQLLLIYGYGQLLCSIGFLLWIVWWVLSGDPTYSLQNSINVRSAIAYAVSRNVSFTVYPVLVILLLRRPEFRRMFESR
jgi:hypothetical protein